MSSYADSQAHKNMRKYALKYAHTIIKRDNGAEADRAGFWPVVPMVGIISFGSKVLR